MSKLILEYARNCYRHEIEELLDDPAWAEGYKQYFTDMRILGKELSLDFDEIVENSGTPFERERLKEIMGKV